MRRVGAAVPAALIGLTLLAIGLLSVAAGASAAAAQVRSVNVEDGTFRITLEDGTVIAQDSLPGTVLALGDGSGRQRTIRIDAVERDRRDPTGEVVLYTLSEPDPGGGWHNLCEPDPDGRRLGFPLPGAFAPDGRYMPSSRRLLITCTGGAEGKCIRFGYKPWRQTPGGTSLGPYYNACVRLVRADYCGDGVGHTRNGTPIDIFDRIGIQRDEPAPGMRFEAAFGPDGAVCVRRTRLPDLLQLSVLGAACPRLAGHTGEACDKSAHALLFVRSAGR